MLRRRKAYCEHEFSGPAVSMKTMNCKEARNLLVALADGELADADRQRIEEHLAKCPDCAGELSALAADRQTLRTIPAPEVPPFVATRVMARISAPAPRARLSPALAASLVLVTAAGLWLGTALGRSIIPQRLSEEAEHAAIAALSFHPGIPGNGGE